MQCGTGLYTLIINPKLKRSLQLFHLPLYRLTSSKYFPTVLKITFKMLLFSYSRIVEGKYKALNTAN